MDFKSIAEQISVHPLSYSMQKTLALEKELDYSVSDFEEDVWMENLQEEENELRVWEEDYH